MEIRGNERLQLLNDFNSMADFFRKNTKRPIEYRLVFFGILVTSLSLLLPFQDKMGIHLNPGLSLSLIISLVILAMNFFSYVGIEINNEKNIYLATVVNTLLIFGWIFMVANKKDSSYAFGFFIYLIGILLMVGGTILHYRKNHMEENKEIYRKSERPEENKINKDI